MNSLKLARRHSNPRIFTDDNTLIRGALRRAFSQTWLHEKVIDRTRVERHDPKRPKVKNWSVCERCKEFTPTYLIDVDHIEPVIPLDDHFEDMSIEEFIDRLWCDLSNLQGICETCHDFKTAQEKNARKPFNKPRKKRDPNEPRKRQKKKKSLR